MLRIVEKKILSYLKTPYRGFFVEIGPVVGPGDKIWTIGLNENLPDEPLVLLHGLGSGIALWVMNLDDLARERPVYAMDVLGFGCSSRPKFSSDPLICESQLVKSVENWRRELNFKKMIMLGHSFGCFIAMSYALSYPNHVRHLILADPWGFSEKSYESEIYFRQIPFWVRAVAYTLMPFNPLSALRAAGPLGFGEWMVKKVRPDIIRKFRGTLELDLLAQYLYQCNAQTPSGESAYHTMMESLGWAKNPMSRRIHHLHDDIGITFIYGSRSWIDPATGSYFKAKRTNSYVDIKIINDADHHLYADQPKVFNQYVNEACTISKLRQQSPFMKDFTQSGEKLQR